MKKEDFEKAVLINNDLSKKREYLKWIKIYFEEGHQIKIKLDLVGVSGMFTSIALDDIVNNEAFIQSVITHLEREVHDLQTEFNRL